MKLALDGMMVSAVWDYRSIDGLPQKWQLGDAARAFS